MKNSVILIENAAKDEKNIERFLILFYSHMLKFITINDQLSSWIGTIKLSSEKNRKI